jgi:hypothetical protein
MHRHCFHRLALACGLMWASFASLAQDEIYVTNSNSNAVTVYALGANGNAAPLRSISGNLTGLSSPSGIAVDLVNGELLVANKTVPYSVTVYPRTASGNVAPLRTVIGASTNLDDPRGIAIDTLHDEFAVVNRAGFSVTTFARTANGNVAPLRSLQTPIGLSNPWGLVVDAARDEILVANNGNFISVFARTANGAAAPLRTISGSNTGFNNGPVGIALESSFFDDVVVSTPFYGPSFEPALLFFPRTGFGNISPTRVIGGNPATTQLAIPNGIAVANGLIYVPNSIANSIAVHQALSTGVAPPIRRIFGAATLLNNPQFAAVATNLFADGFESP